MSQDFWNLAKHQQWAKASQTQRWQALANKFTFFLYK